MSELTATLLGTARPARRRSAWTARLARVADALVAAHGTPRLGNYRDPVREIFYILLSSRTTDGQYRRTFRALAARFSSLSELAAADRREILTCIAAGGLANKKASQIKRTAAALVSKWGENAGRGLRTLPPREAFDFLTGLPGMGPKSALCVMMYSLGADVFPVDVNVQRIAARLGVIPTGLKHYQAQRRLPALVPPGQSRELHIAMVVHGRKMCLPRKPNCSECPLRAMCRYGRAKLAVEGRASG